MDRRQTRRVVLRSCALLTSFLLVATPYVIWLSTETGQFRWEGKTPYNIAVIIPYSTGMNGDEAQYGIDKSLEEVGTTNRPDLSVISGANFTISDILRVVTFNSPPNYKYLVKSIIIGSYFGSPILFALAILGLFRKPWVYESIITHIYLVVVVLGVPFLSLVLAPFFDMDTRKIFLFLPVMIIWAANGVALLSQWACATMRLAGSKGSIARRAGIAAGLTSCALVVITASYGVRKVWDLTAFDYKSQPVKQAGRWLDTLAPGPKTVMDASTILAFHARASYVHFPQRRRRR